MRNIRLVTYATITLSATLVVVLGMRVRTLEESLRAERQRQVILHEGYYVPTFLANTIDGRSVRVGEAERGGKQILLLFTTTCPFCAASIPVWKQLAALTDTFTAFPLSIAAIALDSLHLSRDYVAQHSLTYDIVEFTSPKLRRLYRARRVPQIIVLDEHGRVVYTRVGVIDGDVALDSVRRAVVAR